MGTDLSELSDQTAKEAFTRLYQGTFQQQFRTARLIVGSTSLAEEIAHDAFASVWANWDRIDDPGPYLTRCVVNAARTTKKRSDHRGRIRRLLLVETQNQTNEYLSDCLAALSSNQRTAVVLRYYAGLKNSEIADAMRCPEGSVGPWINRGLAHLRKELL